MRFLSCFVKPKKCDGYSTETDLENLNHRPSLQQSHRYHDATPRHRGRHPWAPTARHGRKRGASVLCRPPPRASGVGWAWRGCGGGPRALQQRNALGGMPGGERRHCRARRRHAFSKLYRDAQRRGRAHRLPLRVGVLVFRAPRAFRVTCYFLAPSNKCIYMPRLTTRTPACLCAARRTASPRSPPARQPFSRPARAAPAFLPSRAPTTHPADGVCTCCTITCRCASPFATFCATSPRVPRKMKTVPRDCHPLGFGHQRAMAATVTVTHVTGAVLPQDACDEVARGP